ncbi:Fructose-1,6-bisphosphatase [Hibiscus syriacus]|uniref:D-fructose-1,6-bisphosphate 1-phosphohydrolase n=1 Tax=Hibiscus syriacus TaxID=106335 RepID=A0A6A3BV84_HIBSY|nr:Fructose-1,6-bisphosphatase [Hibiscus syriacus]
MDFMIVLLGDLNLALKVERETFSNRTNDRIVSRGDSISVSYSSLETNTIGFDDCSCYTKARTEVQVCYSSHSQIHVTTSARDRWVVDSGVTHHITPYLANVINQKDFSGPGKLIVGNGVYLPNRAIGKFVLCSPSRALLLNDLLHGQENDGLYSFQVDCVDDMSTGIEANNVVTSHSLYDLWHRRLGHPAHGTLEQICKTINVNVEKKVNELWPSPVVSNGYRYYVSFVDAYTRHTWLYLLKDKSQAARAFQLFQQLMHTSLKGVNMKTLDLSLAHSWVLALNTRGASSIRKLATVSELSRSLDIVMDINRLYIGSARVLESTTLSLDVPEPSSTQSIPVDVSAALPEVPSVVQSSPAPIVTESDVKVQSLPGEQTVTSMGNTHPMLTCSKFGVFKPKLYTTFLDDVVPSTVDKAFQSAPWNAPFRAEYCALIQNDTWALVPLPDDRSVVHGHDFKDTFSPVVKFTTVYVLLAMASTKGWVLRQVDVNNVFLNGNLSEDVYMQQPSGFKGVYCTYILVYVDDIIITGTSATDVNQVVEMLSYRLSLKDLVELSYFSATFTCTPMIVAAKLAVQYGALLPNAREYRNIVAALLYVFHTRLDIVFAVNKVVQFMQSPCEVHFVAVKRILRYLAGTLNYGLVFSVGDARLNVKAFLGANWAGDASDRSVNPVCHARSKHIELDIHFVWEMIATGQLRVSYVPVGFLVADGLTKTLPKASFEQPIIPVRSNTLDPTYGEFVLTHENIKIPESSKIYSFNEGNFDLWGEKLKNYLDHLRQPVSNGKPYSDSYIGCLVGEIHRMLLRGGIYGNPKNKNNKNGNLRLLYECAPMSFLIEQVGVVAIDGEQRILDIVPEQVRT